MNRPVPPPSTEIDFSDPAFDFTADLPPATPFDPLAAPASYLNYAGSVPARPNRPWWTFGFVSDLFANFNWHALLPSPDWLLSFCIHAGMLIALACITVSVNEPPALSLIEANSNGDALGDLEATENLELSEFASVDMELSELEAAPASLAELDPSMSLELEGGSFMSSGAAEMALAGMSSESMTAGRIGRSKLALLSKYGGTEKTESAVKLGLEWLVKQQTSDGHWSFAGPYSEGSSFTENQVAATGMALLALLGAGHTHQSGQYDKQVHAALKWLVNQQSSDGNFGVNTPVHHAIYTHAIATLAVSEAYAMTNDSWLRPYVDRGVKYTLRAQGKAGGWRYEFRGDSATSVTGWCVMALVSARAASVPLPESNVRRIHAFLNTVDSDDHALYKYMKERTTTAPMTAEGILCRMYLGWPRSSPSIDIATKWLLENYPFRKDDMRYYYWYYATQVMHHAGGSAWKEWNSAMREGLPTLQVAEGEERGSWPPSRSGTDRTAGRLYATCMALYCLEVYYRHMPLYQQ